MKTWEEFLRAGGEWIGSARAWMQRKKQNGSRVTWGSDELLNPPMTVCEVEDVASNSAWAAYKMGYEAAKKDADLQVDRYRKALERIYKRLNDTVPKGYNMYPELDEIARNALMEKRNNIIPKSTPYDTSGSRGEPETPA